MTQLDQVTSQLKLSDFLQSKPRLGNALREYKHTITLNQVQKEVLVGTLLGDASIPLDRGNPRFSVKFAQKSASADYIQHLYDLFKDFVGTPPRVQNIRGGGARNRQSLRFQTYSHSEFKFYDSIFYPAPGACAPARKRHEYKGLRRKKRVRCAAAACAGS